MKYYVIIGIFFALLLNACVSDTNVNRKNIEYPSNKNELKPSTKVVPNQKGKEEQAQKGKEEQAQNEKDLIKKILLNNLINLIETAYSKKEKHIKKMEKEPQDQYNMLVFEKIGWGAGTELMNVNTDRSIRFRRHTYTLLDTIDDNELKEFSDIILLTGDGILILNIYGSLGGTLDIVSDYFYPKRDALNKLDISNLEKIKESFEKILSTIKDVSETSKQLLLDYRNDKNLIKTDAIKREIYVDSLRNRMLEKAMEMEKLRDITKLSELLFLNQRL
ncbi:virulence associated lipoprotein (plasmid) [Borreliella yangtzensis]|uniref:Lipoprotein n=1 Tax=Borreliella yangtzensis TaxID=683292 RepID=A0ABR6PB89_9SPIR|nr:hypothetical protein [Borreliella yangtzensis]